MDETFSARHQKNRFRELITESDAFDFAMSDIVRLRKDMRTLIERLSDIYGPWKREQDRLEREARKKEKHLESEQAGDESLHERESGHGNDVSVVREQPAEPSSDMLLEGDCTIPSKDIADDQMIYENEVEVVEGPVSMEIDQIEDGVKTERVVTLAAAESSENQMEEDEDVVVDLTKPLERIKAKHSNAPASAESNRTVEATVLDDDSTSPEVARTLFSKEGQGFNDMSKSESLPSSDTHYTPPSQTSSTQVHASPPNGSMDDDSSADPVAIEHWRGSRRRQTQRMFGDSAHI